MSRGVFASIAALFSLINAVPGLLAPAAVASVYGVTLDAQSVLAAELLAASYIGYALINWTTKDLTDPALVRGIDVGNLAAWAVSAVIWIYAASSGMTNATGWFGVALTVIFTIGWTYFLLADRRIGTRVVAAAEPR